LVDTPSGEYRSAAIISTCRVHDGESDVGHRHTEEGKMFMNIINTMVKEWIEDENSAVEDPKSWLSRHNQRSADHRSYYHKHCLSELTKSLCDTMAISVPEGMLRKCIVEDEESIVL
jgi:hypothetical protein